MSSSGIEIRYAAAKGIAISDDSLTVDLTDGRTISVPIIWFPRLTHAHDAERANWRLIDHGEGIRWPDLDEDVSVESCWLAEGHRKRRDRFRSGCEIAAHRRSPFTESIASKNSVAGIPMEGFPGSDIHIHAEKIFRSCRKVVEQAAPGHWLHLRRLEPLSRTREYREPHDARPRAGCLRDIGIAAGQE